MISVVAIHGFIKDEKQSDRSGMARKIFEFEFYPFSFSA